MRVSASLIPHTSYIIDSMQVAVVLTISVVFVFRPIEDVMYVFWDAEPVFGELRRTSLLHSA